MAISKIAFPSFVYTGLTWAKNKAYDSTQYLCAYAVDHVYKPLRHYNWQLLRHDCINTVSELNSWLFMLKKSGTFDSQEGLPRLPIPSLEQTLDKLNRSVKPILSAEEFTEATQAMATFAKGKGPGLQEALKAYGEGRECWNEEMWLNSAYLMNRESLLTSSTWYGGDSIHPYQALYSQENIQVERAAHIASLVFKMHEQIQNNTYPPLVLKGAIPSCMEPYRLLFGTTRIPGEQIDQLATCKSTHIAVLVNNLIYKLEIYHEGSLLRESELRRQFRWILDDAKNGKQEPAVSVLTGGKRAQWAQNRQRLMENNGDNVRIVESAVMAFRLSNEEPNSLQAQSELASKNHHDLWLDKTLILTCSKNGCVSGTNEHAPIDADTPALAIDNAYKQEMNPKKEKELLPLRKVRDPIRLHWSLSDELETEIDKTDEMLKESLTNLDLQVQTYNLYGMNFIKNLNLSPDSFVQIAIQWAYYRLYGEVVFTYETAGTRKFLKARTETTRSASIESKEMCEALSNPVYTNKTKCEMIRKAVERHLQIRTEASLGQGIDRHLLGLRILDQGQDPFFTSKAVNLPVILATSQTPCRNSTGGGFHPVHKEGYGVSYFPRNDHMIFHISSYHDASNTDSAKFLEALNLSLTEFYNLFTKS